VVTSSSSTTRWDVSDRRQTWAADLAAAASAEQKIANDKAAAELKLIEERARVERVAAAANQKVKNSAEQNVAANKAAAELKVIEERARVERVAAAAKQKVKDNGQSRM
jgi:hypothetical protein